MPGEIYPGDPVTMREETRAILLRGELAVSDEVVRQYSRGEPGQYIVDNPRNGRSYSKYGSMAAWFYLVYSTALQWQVNKHSFMAFYSLRGPLEQTMGISAASFFLQHSYGRVLWDCSRAQDRLTDLPWWKEMQPLVDPQTRAAYEQHVRDVLSNRNFYWLKTK